MAVAEALLGLWQCAVIISLIKKCVIKILCFWNSGMYMENLQLLDS